jgi:hypothetical protein
MILVISDLISVFLSPVFDAFSVLPSLFPILLLSILQWVVVVVHNNLNKKQLNPKKLQYFEKNASLIKLEFKGTKNIFR